MQETCIVLPQVKSCQCGLQTMHQAKCIFPTAQRHFLITAVTHGMYLGMRGPHLILADCGAV